MSPSKRSANTENSPTLPDTVRTLGELFRYARTVLNDAALTSPDADARALFAAATGAGPGDIIFRGDEPYTDSAGRARLVHMLARRVAREPLQHILGTAPMMSLELKVGPGVFVPRPETELLAQWAIERAGELVASDVVKPKIVDLCTGSGALALAIADALPEAQVVAVELSAAARKWAEQNIAAYGDGRVRLLAGDVTDCELIGADGALAQWAGQTDIVVSNPPYVPEATEVAPEVRADPHDAVFGGDDGLDVIRPMMNLVDGLVRPGGFVGIEHDDSSGGDVSALLADSWHYADVRVHQDFAGRDRFTVARKPGA
ncbi:MAG: peptide chain release factor N(5)-glutamine methyltransferase [Corynebacterium sp.]|uniref:peptide chain release factor N(5)-glutamine methyltransferase n=1 Tax=Corynebacterium sp. TaxID=1720 RepID=UPI0026DC781F|nr:peptide chain release factor N(5)-glutamine methyltransferase [Corynebacterium sp.]MDO5029409.1 peptide chain release factor N(5)-glutamine methyltransferase [Corynebacterium sp.]